MGNFIFCAVILMSSFITSHLEPWQASKMECFAKRTLMFNKVLNMHLHILRSFRCLSTTKQTRIHEKTLNLVYRSSYSLLQELFEKFKTWNYNLKQQVVDKFSKLGKTGFFFGMFWSWFFASFYQKRQNSDKSFSNS